MFMAFMKAHQHDLISTTADAASLITRAFMASHRSIVYGKPVDQIFELGTTTMLAGVLLELAQPDPVTGHRYAFVFGSIGDCKAYVYSQRTDSFDEITKGT